MYYLYSLDIRYQEEKILRSCSSDIKVIIEIFFDNFYNAVDRARVSKEMLEPIINGVVDAAHNLSKNTVFGEKIGEKGKKFIKLTFNELITLFVEAINNINRDNYYLNKINCINKLLFKNNHIRLFNEYKNLYKVISLVNSNYDELVKRGFSIKTCNDIIDCLYDNHDENTDAERIELFKGILNGTMKFHPKYEQKAIGYQIVPSDYNDQLIEHSDSIYSRGYQLDSIINNQKCLNLNHKH
jgi:hypothetical protein